MTTSLKHRDYISAGGSFGSSQMWFDANGSLLERTLRADGCGAVAAADTLAYLRANGTLGERAGTPSYDCDRATAMLRIQSAHRHIAFVCPAVGVLGISIADGLQRRFRKDRARLFVRWYCPPSSGRLLAALYAMLCEDFPVILSLPPRLVLYSPLWLYPSESAAAARITQRAVAYKSRHGHYVVATALCGDDTPILEISSWGKRYYIRFDEYAVLRRTPLPCLAGGIVRITHTN